MTKTTPKTRGNTPKTKQEVRELVLFGTKSSGGNENLGLVGVSTAVTGDFSGTLRIPRWTVPSGLTALSVFVRFTGATAGTFVIGKPCFQLVE